MLRFSFFNFQISVLGTGQVFFLRCGNGPVCSLLDGDSRSLIGFCEISEDMVEISSQPVEHVVVGLASSSMK